MTATTGSRAGSSRRRHAAGAADPGDYEEYRYDAERQPHLAEEARRLGRSPSTMTRSTG